MRISLDRFWEDTYYGWLDDADVRVSAYWSIISGAAGYTYGCNDIWQMYESKRVPTIKARTDWYAAIDLPGSTHMKFMKEIFEFLPWQKMNYNQALILNDNPENESYMVSAIGDNKDLIVAYTPTGNSIELDLTQMGAETANAYWYNPRSGGIAKIGDFDTKSPYEFTPWSDGWGSDFLLILVSEKAKLMILQN